MGQNQSCFCEDEIGTEARSATIKDANSERMATDTRPPGTRSPADSGKDKEVLFKSLDADGSNAGVCSTSQGIVVDSIDYSDKDLQISKFLKSKRPPVEPVFRKKKRRPWLPWKKKKDHREMVTTGRTIELDSENSMVVYDSWNLRDAMRKKINKKTMCRDGKDHFSSAYTTLDDSQVSKTKLIVKDIEEMRDAISMKLNGRKDCFVDPAIVSGMQIFVTRCVESEYAEEKIDLSESAPQVRAPLKARSSSFVPKSSLYGMNVLKPSTVEQRKVDDLILICRDKLGFNHDKSSSEKRAETSAVSTILQVIDQDSSRRIYNFSDEPKKFSTVLSAVVPRGIGRKLFTPERTIDTKVKPVQDMLCIDRENQIFVCDLGLTSDHCDFIVDTTERCAKGSYSAYTYAKQTLGCRDYDDIATLCELPVMRAYSSIINHLEKRVSNKVGTVERKLVLDDREPHLVKYDTSKKERQKLDMHTDKSEWTFIIALSDGDGGDYFGGGTYLECMDSTIHLQKGQALIFPGKRRHRGQKIINGVRFLLVGFLVEKREKDDDSEDSAAIYDNYEFDSIF